MTKLNVTSVIAGTVTAAALTIAVSGSSLTAALLGGGMGDHIGHTKSTNVIETNKVTHLRFYDHRRFRFVRFGYVNVDASPVCF